MRSAKIRQRRTLQIVLAAVAVLAVTAAVRQFLPAARPKAEESSAQRSVLLMDTVVDLRVDGQNSAELAERAIAQMRDLEQRLSRFIEASEVAQINRQAGEWVKVSPAAIELIELGIQMGEISGGAFDITIGAVLDAWGFGSAEQKVPSDAELAPALAGVDYTKIELDLGQNSVRIPPGTILDLGGIAKGYIVREGIRLLRQAGVQRAIINAGGDIAVIGRRPDGQPWRVGVQDPFRPSQLRWILPLEDRCVVTSGDYQRYFEQDGQRWHHIIDPHSGYPARGLHSVTVIGDDTTVCDALATAIFVLGPEKGRQLAEDLADVEVILIGGQGEWISPALNEILISR